jgi:hypothetical protein
MPDIAFSTLSLPASWSYIAQNHRLSLGICHQSGSWPVVIKSDKNSWIILLSRTDSADRVLREFRKYPDRFIDKLGICAGIIWQPHTGKLCVFRDKFGFIPLMLIHHEDGGITVTSSPELHTEHTRHRAVNRAYFGRFLRMIDTPSTDDVFDHTERILPGEIRHFSTTPNQGDNIDWHYQTSQRSCYWHRRHYTPLNSSYSNLTEQLRQVLIEAASRIPSENPIFTLSGGLDSSGILASYCYSHHPSSIDAFSLISTSHATCDESHELNILERTFPIQLQRINMDKAWPLSEPELYHKYRSYGPLVAPGIESTLAIYRKIENQFGPRMVITGYGGNFIVKVRNEALWRHLLTHAVHHKQTRTEIINEISVLRCQDLRLLAARILGNLADGKIRETMKGCFTPHHHNPYIFNNLFAAQFPIERTDPVFFMSHCEERAWLPISWEWEMCVRALDIIARETSHSYYDPLFDPEVYNFCAQIPPQYFLQCKDYRTIYKDALAPLLPKEIIHHPKIQSFDDLMLDGLCLHAKNFILHKIETSPIWIQNILNTNALANAFKNYCQASRDRTSMPYPITHIWRALSTCIWGTN